MGISTVCYVTLSVGKIGVRGVEPCAETSRRNIFVSNNKRKVPLFERTITRNEPSSWKRITQSKEQEKRQTK